MPVFECDETSTVHGVVIRDSQKWPREKTDGQTDRQAQRERERDGQTDRWSETERQTEREREMRETDDAG